MPAIHAQALSRSFGSVRAVDRLDLAVEPGEIFGLVGPDGAGKTTTMRMLTGILRPTSGNATVDGRDVVRDGESLKSQVGYMSQRFGLYADLTVEENIRFYADIYGVAARDRNRRMDELLAFSNLSPFRERLAGNLSGGMKQKLGLACALIHTPRVLFLDEPTNGVDPVSRRDFWRILYQLLRQHVTIFVSTAYLDEAERCNRLALLHEGRLLGLGTPAEVKALMPGSLLEVRCRHPRRAAQRLREEMPGDTVGLFGDRLHVATLDAARAQTRIHEILRAADLGLEAVAPVEPTLEDVFVAVLGQKSGGRSSAGVSSSDQTADRHPD